MMCMRSCASQQSDDHTTALKLMLSRARLRLAGVGKTPTPADVQSTATVLSDPQPFFGDLLGFIGAIATGPTTFWLPPVSCCPLHGTIIQVP